MSYLHRGLNYSAFAVFIFSVASPLVAVPLVNAQPATEAGAANQARIEEVIVSARMRSENLQDVPVAVRAFNDAVIEEAGITSMRDYAGMTPNFFLQETQNTGFAFVNMRGLSTQRNTDQAVAVSVDGVVLTNSLVFSQEMFDIEQIEVLKGPQGALYGRNSAGGAINITTKQPSNEFDAMFRAGVGNGDFYKAETTVSGPIVEDQLLYRIAASYQDSDGTRENITLNQPADPYEETAVRGKLLWFASDTTTLDLRLNYSESQASALQFISNAPIAVDEPGFVTGPLGTGGAGIPSNGFTTRVPKAEAVGVGTIVGDANNTSVKIWGNQPGEDNRESWSVSGKVDVELNGGTFTSISSYDEIEHLTEGEQLFYLPRVAFPGLNAINSQNRFGDAWSQEFRFTSPDNEPLRWIVGAYAAQTNLDVYFSIMDDLGLGVDSFRRAPNSRSNPISPTKLFAAQFFGAAGVPAPITNPGEALAALGDTNDNFAYALFGQAAYDLSDALELSLALRYDSDEREQTTDLDQQYLPQYQDPISGDISGPLDGTVRKRDFDSVQPKATLRWQPSDELTLYGVYSEGFRSGGFNPSGTAQAIDVMANAGVVGLPSGVEDSFDKEESQSFEIGLKSIFADGDISFNAAAFVTNLDNTFAFFFVGPIAAQTIRNVEESEIQGLEFDVTWSVNDNLSFDVAYGLIDSEIKKSSFLGVGGINLVGNELPLNPEDTFNFAVSLHQPIGSDMEVYARLDYERMGEMYFSLENWGTRDPVNLVDLRVGLRSEAGWEVNAWVKNATDENYFNELFNTFGIGYYAPERRFGADLTFRF